MIMLRYPYVQCTSFKQIITPISYSCEAGFSTINLTIRYYSAVFHIRIRKLLGLTDPDPLVNGTDPDPSIVKQK
jgi:hypothetical protein